MSQRPGREARGGRLRSWSGMATDAENTLKCNLTCHWKHRQRVAIDELKVNYLTVNTGSTAWVAAVVLVP